MRTKARWRYHRQHIQNERRRDAFRDRGSRPLGRRRRLQTTQQGAEAIGAADSATTIGKFLNIAAHPRTRLPAAAG